MQPQNNVCLFFNYSKLKKIHQFTEQMFIESLTSAVEMLNNFNKTAET